MAVTRRTNRLIHSQMWLIASGRCQIRADVGCDRLATVVSCRSMRWLPVFMLAWAFGGCSGDCMRSSDIQVTVVPNPDVSVSKITKLRVVLMIADGAAHSYDLTPAHQLEASG